MQLVSALVHDTDHPGVMNTFMVSTGHPVAKLRGETPTAVLEHHHARMAAALLDRCGRRVSLVCMLGALAATCATMALIPVQAAPPWLHSSLATVGCMIANGMFSAGCVSPAIEQLGSLALSPLLLTSRVQPLVEQTCAPRRSSQQRCEVSVSPR